MMTVYHVQENCSLMEMAMIEARRVPTAKRDRTTQTKEKMAEMPFVPKYTLVCLDSICLRSRSLFIPYLHTFL